MDTSTLNTYRVTLSSFPVPVRLIPCLPGSTCPVRTVISQAAKSLLFDLPLSLSLKNEQISCGLQIIALLLLFSSTNLKTIVVKF